MIRIRSASLINETGKVVMLGVPISHTACSSSCNRANGTPGCLSVDLQLELQYLRHRLAFPQLNTMVQTKLSCSSSCHLIGNALGSTCSSSYCVSGVGGHCGSSMLWLGSNRSAARAALSPLAMSCGYLKHRIARSQASRAAHG